MEIVIYGTHCDEWNSKLTSKKLWKQIGFENVIHLTELNHKPEYIFPMLEKHYLHLESKFPELFDYNNIKILSNKYLFYLFIISNNLTKYIPKTWIEFSSDIIFGENLYILKEYNLNYGAGSKICQRIEDIDFNDKILQEYLISNYEYTSHIIFKKNKLLKIITYEYQFPKNIYIRNIYTHPIHTHKIELNNEYVKVFIDILQILKYEGICNIDFKIINSCMKILEINPRMGGSLLMNEDDLSEILRNLFFE